MKTVRRLIYAEVAYAVLFVALGFLSLFFFFDLVDELSAVGKDGPKGYQLTHALLYVALLVPSHLYELLPIAVLIGCVFVLSRLAQSSEFTILRTSGLGPGLALKTMLQLGLVFVALTFLIGDYLAPPSDRAAQLLKGRFQGRITVGQIGGVTNAVALRGDYAYIGVGPEQNFPYIIALKPQMAIIYSQWPQTRSTAPAAARK